MLKAVARRMGDSKATVPHFYLTSEIDMTRALALREGAERGARRRRARRSAVNDLIVRASAPWRSRLHPQAHRSYVDGKHVYHAHANVGIAVALDDGLIVPVLRDADTKTVRTIAVEARDLAERARAGKLRQREIEGGTFTVSNLGMLGVSSFAAIINPPESAILAVSATIQRPVVRRRRRHGAATSCRSRSRATTARAPEPTARGCSRPSSATSRRRPCCSHDHPTPRTLDLMQLTDVMATQVVSVTPETGIGDAARRMVESDIGAAVVLDAEGTLWSA